MIPCGSSYFFRDIVYEYYINLSNIIYGVFIKKNKNKKTLAFYKWLWYNIIRN